MSRISDATTWKLSRIQSVAAVTNEPWWTSSARMRYASWRARALSSRRGKPWRAQRRGLGSRVKRAARARARSSRRSMLSSSSRKGLSACGPRPRSSRLSSRWKLSGTPSILSVNAGRGGRARAILVLTCGLMEKREEAGQYPFTRGLHPGGYRGKLWTMRQYAGFGTAAESNRRYRYLLERGTTGLSVAFDLPTQIGYDSDDPQAMGEVGRVGVAIDSLEDMEVLLEGIPLERVSTSMTINATAAILLALYVAVARRR